MNKPLALSTFCALAAAAAALALGPPGGETKRVSAGQWGAMGIAMEVTEAGATIEYDCARGTIDEPLVLDAEGRFDVKGRHFREHPGPRRESEDSNGQPVRYVGQVSGDFLALAVKPEGSDSAIGNHQLTRGKMGRIHKCL